jgi:hypothetical protein
MESGIGEEGKGNLGRQNRGEVGKVTGMVKDAPTEDSMGIWSIWWFEIGSWKSGGIAGS